MTITAEPAAVWPWLVMPAFQHLAVGDELTLGGSGPTMRAHAVEPCHTLVWASDAGDWTWTFLLTPIAGGTRLISRNRLLGPDSPLLRRLYAAVMVPGSLLMERKMLRGIAQRAERSRRVTEDPR
ncbi:hypothetical protein [Nocardia asteroides]|uniref:hypothetical protein n=1 Tax=Nocardia asteroides TaxID=1824 RepID=UPI00343C56A8